jgi:hypothetical protein
VRQPVVDPGTLTAYRSRKGLGELAVGGRSGLRNWSTPVSLVEYSLADHVPVIRLNRPERLNAMSPAMGEELVEAFRRFNADDNLRQ